MITDEEMEKILDTLYDKDIEEWENISDEEEIDAYFETKFEEYRKSKIKVDVPLTLKPDAMDINPFDKLVEDKS